ncbi:serine--tRNA ligase [Candidatus Peregrinibacteria bacterium]|jgi:seryl-tRNA synthetase|nr:serine--tRNA ligase [Candidatus Peregrinibacteria bacterium]MBT5468586.1 serine--tRNA ligase [Candidatus Peregrinibacteria bacterium]MBT7337612.1 serine--tRNA ligase [Candidatus Peregrinibacteria bacterium]
MIDLNDLRARPDAYKKAAKDKNLTIDIDAFFVLDEKRKALIPRIEEARAKQNVASKKIPQLEGEEKAALLAEMKTLSDDLKKSEAELKAVETEWKNMQFTFPSVPLDNVPVGKDESGNVEVMTWGEKPTFDFEPKDHVELGEALDIIDIPRGAKVSGARNYYLKGDGARLQKAIMNFTIDHLHAKGWTMFSPPLMATYECFMGTGFFPGADENQIYVVGGKDEKTGTLESDNLHLIGTSEVTVCSYHKDEILKQDELPKRYAGHSACFRREAGTYGKDTKGLYRVHQFEKVEQVVLCEANEEESLKIFEEIRKNAEEVLQALKLPYRIIDVCTGDMGKSKIYMQDIETWMPSRDSYGETHSCSYLGDFQARRLNIRYDDPSADSGQAKKFCHTLNNTCVASPRILIPVIEQYQNADGTITVPEVLRPYMGGQEIIGQ